MGNLDLLVTCLDFIESHLCEDMKTLDIANACHVSKSTLEKVFQYVNHISVHGYVIRRRMMLAARRIAEHPEESILSIALEYGYQSNEAFTRAFKGIWNCNPSEFRQRKFVELYPKLRKPISEGDAYIMGRKSVDISQLYDLVQERKSCYFIGCDIKRLKPMNDISRKMGDLAILETMSRMEAAAGEEDMIFRIGGDEFCILTGSDSKENAGEIAEKIRQRNGEPFSFEGQEIPLYLHLAVTKIKEDHPGHSMKYDELFSKLHTAIHDAKR